MEKFRAIRKQIEELDIFEDVTHIAIALTELDSDLNNLSEKHVETLLWLNTVIPAQDDMKQDFRTIAKATLVGMDSIKKAINEISILLQIEVEKVYAQIRKMPELILTSSDQPTQTYCYLKDFGMSTEQSRELFFDAILLNENALHHRCELVLKHWSIDDLVYLAKNGLLSNLPYYDVIEAVTAVVGELGSEKAIEFLHFYPPFLVEYRTKYYRKLPGDVFLYEDALKALDEYKKSNP